VVEKRSVLCLHGLDGILLIAQLIFLFHLMDDELEEVGEVARLVDEIRIF
jgi:hypothetical protein